MIRPLTTGRVLGFSRRRGFTLLEVLVAVVVLLVGVIPIILLMPDMLRARNESELLTRAALLAQRKAEEIRRDDSPTVTLISSIQARTLATIPAPVVYPDEPRLSYTVCGETLLYRDMPTGQPVADPGVARVIVLKTPENPSADPLTWNVLYELRFGP